MTTTEYQSLIATRGLKSTLGVPSLHTSKEWNAGNRGWLESFHGNEKEAEFVAQQVQRRTGKRPKSTDRWIQELAQVGGDPNAVIPSGDGPSIVKKRVEKLNIDWDDGFVKHTRTKLPPQSTPLSERAIREHLRTMVKQEPGKLKTKAQVQKVRAAIVAKHSIQGVSHAI